MNQVKNNGVEDKILNAALKVVNEKTFSGTRMHLIASKALIGQSNVHYYYKTKDELMLALQEKVLQKCYEIRKECSKKIGDTLEEKLHIFFQQKKYLISKKRDYDFAEMDFLVQSKINKKIQDRFKDSYDQWREDIREIIVNYCPNISRNELEVIPYMVVSLLQGASVQILVDYKDFGIDSYFEHCEKMILDYIKLQEN